MNLRLMNIEFTYGSVPILNKISFELKHSEFLGIVGPNGSGKSTLIKCIDQILKPQKGTMFLDDCNINSMSRIEIAQSLAYVPQKTTGSFSTTVFDSVLMGRRPHASWRGNSNDLDKAENVIKRMELEGLALRDVLELSGGQQQKVLIARAIAQEARVLLLDEPVANLDIRHQLEVMDIILKLVREENLSSIMAIHDLNLASRFMDKIIMMKDGEIFAAGCPSEVFTKENISKVYGVEVKIAEEDGVRYIIPFKKVV